MSELKKNLIYNILYQILIIILPIITVPYVSRVLGTEGVGTYSYTYSIAYYFMLVSMLGINNYGNRQVAKARNNKEKLSKEFLSIYVIQVVTTILMIIAYIAYIVLFDIDYLKISIIQIIYVISSLFDVNWFFFGIEKFKFTVSRNTIVKVLSFVFILIFVKTETDTWKYTLILALSTLISQIFLFIMLRKYIKIERISFKHVKKHIKPCIILFIPIISYSIYRVMDKIMLGNMSTISEVGFYENAEKIINIPVGLITALGTVMLPRISNLIANGEKNLIEEYMKKSVELILFIGLPMIFGLMAISENFSVSFLGEDFRKSGDIMFLLSPTILFISIANVIRTQYLIPNEKDKEYVIATICGAIVNLIFNIILIPKLGSIGACIGTLLAEFTVMLYQIILVRKKIQICAYLKNGIRFLVTSLLMFIIVFSLNFLNIKNIILLLIIQIVVGIIIYGIFNINYIINLLKREKRTI